MSRLSTVVTIATLIWLGCGGKATNPQTASSSEEVPEEEVEETPQVVETPSVSDYLPLRVGARWTYGMQSDGSKHYIISIVAKLSRSDTTWYELAESRWVHIPPGYFVKTAQDFPSIPELTPLPVGLITAVNGKLILRWRDGQGVSHDHVLLKEPITVGTVWTVEDQRLSLEIQSISDEVKTYASRLEPSGAYQGVVTVRARTQDGSEELLYFAKDVGLVKRGMIAAPAWVLDSFHIFRF